LLLSLLSSVCLFVEGNQSLPHELALRLQLIGTESEVGVGACVGVCGIDRKEGSREVHAVISLAIEGGKGTEGVCLIGGSSNA